MSSAASCSARGHLCSHTMADKLTEKVLSTANLLVEAVKELKEGGKKQPEHTAGSGRSLPSCSGSSMPPSCSSGSGNVHSELSKMFSWNSKGKKRQLNHPTKASKKQKLKTWTHTFVCLSSTKQIYMPDTSERTALKLAGLGEKRFPVFAYATSTELQDELYQEYPKLVRGGGFELLRGSDVGAKELVLIDIPHDGYSVEYLRAVVKSAKVFIRPLQRDLDCSQLENKVYVYYACNAFVIAFLSCSLHLLKNFASPVGNRYPYIC